jgi:hypothetical protein
VIGFGAALTLSRFVASQFVRSETGRSSYSRGISRRARVRRANGRDSSCVESLASRSVIRAEIRVNRACRRHGGE